MGTRRKARECALQLLYQVDLSEHEPVRVFANFWSQLEEPLEEGVHEFSEQLVDGVWGRREEIDEMIATYSTNWKVSRMATVDKNILRLAIYELLYCPDIPVKVTINEAVEIAKRFGTAESSAFVNGILDNVARERAQDKFQEHADDRA